MGTILSMQEYRERKALPIILDNIKHLTSGTQPYHERDHVFTPWQKDENICGLCAKPKEGHF